MAIQNVIVVMLENRSYDNVLGALYQTTTPPPGQADLNGIPTGATNAGPDGTVFPVHNQLTPTGTGPSPTVTFAPTTIPMLDPKELFGDMAQQFLGGPGVPQAPPYTAYSPAASGLMSGFVDNYAQPPGSGQETIPSQNYGDVMNYLSPEQLPVTAFLARNFAVCDQWFASVPTQTFTNRAFALSAAPATTDSASLVNDGQYIADPPVQLIPTRTIFDQLDANQPGAVNWKVYFHDYSLAMVVLPQVNSIGASAQNVNVATFDDTDWGTAQPKGIFAKLGNVPSTFVEDLAAGTLPLLSWIEPRYNDNWAPGHLPPNCNHPGTARFPFIPGSSSPIDAATGEVFLMQLYNMLQANPTVFENVLLIITYDEPGGTYDHVPPLVAAAPGRGTLPATGSCPFGALGCVNDPAANGFDYTVFGGRVPAIIVSPCIIPGTTIRSTSETPFDHTSIIRTVADLFIGPTSLTDRDAAAPSLTSSLTGPVGTQPFTGQLVCGPQSLAYLISADVFTTGPSSLAVFASAGPNIDLTANTTESWLTVVGATSTPYMSTFTFQVETSNLANGTYGATAVISTVSEEATNSPMHIPVTLILS